MCYSDDGFFNLKHVAVWSGKNICCVLTEDLLSFIDFHFVVCADEYSVCNVSSAYLTLNHIVGLYVDS